MYRRPDTCQLLGDEYQGLGRWECTVYKKKEVFEQVTTVLSFVWVDMLDWRSL